MTTSSANNNGASGSTPRGRAMRTRLVEATIASIAHDGLAGASVEAITRRAGVSRVSCGTVRRQEQPSRRGVP